MSSSEEECLSDVLDDMLSSEEYAMDQNVLVAASESDSMDDDDPRSPPTLVMP